MFRSGLCFFEVYEGDVNVISVSCVSPGSEIGKGKVPSFLIEEYDDEEYMGLV